MILGLLAAHTIIEPWHVAKHHVIRLYSGNVITRPGHDAGRCQLCQASQTLTETPSPFFFVSRFLNRAQSPPKRRLHSPRPVAQFFRIRAPPQLPPVYPFPA